MEDYIIKQWQELVKDAHNDVTCEVVSKYSPVIITVEAERCRLQFGLSDAVRQLDMLESKFKIMEKKLLELQEKFK